MAVYVDDFNAPYRRMKMSHMVADSKEELLAMVDVIGVNRKWIQYPDTNKEHFDICLGKKELAIKNGAILITARKLAKATLSRKDNNSKIEL